MSAAVYKLFHQLQNSISIKLNTSILTIQKEKYFHKKLCPWLFLFTCASQFTFAQENSYNRLTREQAFNKDKDNKIKTFNVSVLCGAYPASSSPLTNESFNKMMKNEFFYTILGNKSPVSGFKLETTNPSATLSGNILVNKVRSFILNLQLVASTSNNISEIFSQNKLNGSFSATLGFNFMLTGLQRGVYYETKERMQIKHHVIEVYAHKLSSEFHNRLISSTFVEQLFQNTITFSQFVSRVYDLDTAARNLGIMCDMTPDDVRATVKTFMTKY